jgi:hypothetical protein
MELLVIGPAEIREWREDARYFNPIRVESAAPVVPIGNIESIMDFAGMVLGPRRRLATVGVAS